VTSVAISKLFSRTEEELTKQKGLKRGIVEELWKSDFHNSQVQICIMARPDTEQCI